MPSARNYRWETMPAEFPMPLAQRRRVIGEHVMVSHVTLEQGCLVPTHAHENEQICCVLSGRLRFEIGEAQDPAKRVVVLAAGDALHLPPHVPHSAFVEEAAIVLDIFSPPSATTGIDQTRA